MIKDISFEHYNLSGIYMISHPECDKFYIGSTKNFALRHYQHCADHKYGYTSKSILELSEVYGFNNLIFSVIEVCPNLTNLKTMEQFYFDVFSNKLVNKKRIAVRNYIHDK